MKRRKKKKRIYKRNEDHGNVGEEERRGEHIEISPTNKQHEANELTN